MSDAALRGALASGDPGVRLAALEELGARPRALDEATALVVAACLVGPGKSLQRRAADALRLGGAGSHPAVVTRLRAECGAADSERAWGAAYALGQLGVVEAALIAPILAALASADGDRRWAAAELLVACGQADAAATLPAIFAALETGSPPQRKMLLYVLRDLAPPGAAATAAFAARMRDPDAGVRHAALSGLVRLDPRPPGAAALVLAMLQDDPDPGLRRAAASTLGRLGADPAVDEALRAAEASDDPALRRAAAAARRALPES